VVVVQQLQGDMVASKKVPVRVSWWFCVLLKFCLAQRRKLSFDGKVAPFKRKRGAAITAASLTKAEWRKSENCTQQTNMFLMLYSASESN